ncbi:MAG: hypothetical protein H0W84_04645 [Bacteroidetes bacterium]|nr:hypothetical protein [Bacteroidota bacterium]
MAKQKTKARVVKKTAPAKQKSKSKKASTSVKHKTKAKAIKKVSTPARQRAKSKKASTPVKHKPKVNAVKKVNTPAKQKARAVTVKKTINLKKGIEKNTKLKAKTKSPERTNNVIERTVVPPVDFHGENLHFIPEHNGITHPVTPLEANKMENIFHHKEKVALQQANQKIRNAQPSRKTMKVFNRNKGF